MSNEDYAKGYNDGFRAGLEAGKELKSPPQKPPNLWPEYPSENKGYACKVCGMFFEAGKAYGYACMHSKCPTRLTCTSSVTYNAPNTNWSSWTTFRPVIKIT